MTGEARHSRRLGPTGGMPTAVLGLQATLASQSSNQKLLDPETATYAPEEWTAMMAIVGLTQMSLEGCRAVKELKASGKLLRVKEGENGKPTPKTK